MGKRVGMTTPAAPEVFVFDVVGTLADLQPVENRMQARGLPAGSLDPWFRHMLRDAMALTLAGDYRPFPDVAASALRSHTRGALSDDDVEWILGGFSETRPHPDAVPAVDAALKSGARVFALSNGAASSTEGFLDRAGIRDRVEQILSIDDVRAWKPSPAPYRLAVERAGVPASSMAMIAVHGWDLHGASRVGLRTGWCSREEGVLTPAFARPDVVADRLDDVVRGLATPSVTSE